MIEWKGDASELVKALTETHWLEPSKQHRLLVHDWPDHCPRWVLSKLNRAGQEPISHINTVSTVQVTAVQSAAASTVKSVQATTHATSLSPSFSSPPFPSGKQGQSSKPIDSPSATALQELWNTVTEPPLPRCSKLTQKRKQAAKARLRETDMKTYQQVAKRINASAFCRGENDRGWCADFDFFLRPDTPVKVLEGKYDRAKQPSSARLGEHKPPETTGEIKQRSQQQIRLAVRRKFGGGQWMQAWLSARLEAPEFPDELAAVTDYERFCLERKQAEIEATP